jgi:hypothetical protein
LGHGEDDAERRDRPDQRQHQDDERNEGAGGDGALADSERAEQQHGDEADVGDDLEERPEPRGKPHLLHRRVVERPRAPREVAVAVGRAPERPDRAVAEGRLFDLGRDVALLVLHPPRDDDVLALELAAQHDDRDRRHRDHETQRPVHVQQHCGHDEQLDDVDDQEQQAEAHEAPDRAEVLSDTRQQLAALPATVEFHRQGLQVPVQVVADVGLEAEHRSGLDPSPREDQAGLGDSEGHREDSEWDQRADLAVGDGAVDDRLRHQRDREADEDSDDGRAAHGGQRAAVWPQIAAQPPQRLCRMGAALLGRLDDWIGDDSLGGGHQRLSGLLVGSRAAGPRARSGRAEREAVRRSKV